MSRWWASSCINSRVVCIVIFVHANIIHNYGLENLGTQDLGVRILWQLEVEETSICSWQQFILLVSWILGSCLDKNSVDVIFESFISVWNAFLAPTELNELLFVILAQILQEVPEILDNWSLVVIFLARVSANTTIVGASSQKSHVNVLSTADHSL
jgi:hypothetical protein